MEREALHIGAVAFIHRFGSSLNEHVHFHVCVVDGVFEDTIFHPASGIDEAAVAKAQTNFRRRILRAFVGRGLIESCDAKEMLAYQHSGFSVDAGVCIEARDRAALERLLRYCARPPFAMTGYAKRALPWWMRAVAPEASIRFEPICETPAFLARADDVAVLLAGRLAEADSTTLVAFGTEAGLFQKAGIRRWCAARATLPRRIRRMSTCRWRSSRRESGFCRR